MRLGETFIPYDCCPRLLEKNDVVLFGVGKGEGTVVRGWALADVCLEDPKASSSISIHARPSRHKLGAGSCCRRLLRREAIASGSVASGSMVVATTIHDGEETVISSTGLAGRVVWPGTAS